MDQPVHPFLLIAGILSIVQIFFRLVARNITLDKIGTLLWPGGGTFATGSDQVGLGNYFCYSLGICGCMLVAAYAFWGLVWIRDQVVRLSHAVGF